MSFARQWLLRICSFALTGLYSLYRISPAVWRLMARNYRPWMARFARLHAWMTCQFAALDVPAYGELPLTDDDDLFRDRQLSCGQVNVLPTQARHLAPTRAAQRHQPPQREQLVVAHRD